MNPYEPPILEINERTEPSPPIRTIAPLGRDQLAMFAQLGVRLLGVMFVVEGIGGVLGSSAYALSYIAAYDHQSLGTPADPYSFGWLCSSLVLLVVGIYFVVGGQWVIEKVFLPAAHSGPS